MCSRGSQRQSTPGRDRLLEEAYPQSQPLSTPHGKTPSRLRKQLGTSSASPTCEVDRLVRALSTRAWYGSHEQICGVDEQGPEPDQTYLNDRRCGEKQRNRHTSLTAAGFDKPAN